ncbi:MAG: Hpt domain-containing protein [Nitrospirae bacterium]|nr:MAG: Hpt domain-containing protein [Nitrospirota bacterium]
MSDSIDREKALEWLDGDEKFFLKLKAMLVKDLPEHVEELKTGIAQNDIALVERISHSIKGAASMAGAAPLKDLACRIESSAMQGDIVKAGELFGLLKQEAERAVKDLNEKI